MVFPLPVRAVAIVSCVLFPGAPGALLAEKVWTSPGDGLWQDAANWSTWNGINGTWAPTSPPNSSSFLKITNSTTKIITINALTPSVNLTAQKLTLPAPPGATNTLSLSNVGTNNPLLFQAGLELQDGAAVRVANSALQVSLANDHINLDGSLTLDSGLVDLSGPLPDPAWTAVAPSTNGTGGILSLRDTSASGPMRFYHVIAR